MPCGQGAGAWFPGSAFMASVPEVTNAVLAYPQLA